MDVHIWVNDSDTTLGLILSWEHSENLLQNYTEGTGLHCLTADAKKTFMSQKSKYIDDGVKSLHDKLNQYIHFELPDRIGENHFDNYIVINPKSLIDCHYPSLQGEIIEKYINTHPRKDGLTLSLSGQSDLKISWEELSVSAPELPPGPVAVEDQ